MPYRASVSGYKKGGQTALTQEQLTYLAAALPLNPQAEEIVRLHHDAAWGDAQRQRLMGLLDSYAAWLNSAQVHNLLEGLPLNPAYRVRLEESWMWLQCWQQPQGYGGGNEMGTRIIILPPNAEPETTLHEGVGHTAFADYFYQRDDLQQALMQATKDVAAMHYDAIHGIPSPLAQDTIARCRAYVWGEYNERGEKFEGFINPPNPAELFASLVSACRGRRELLPVDLGAFFAGCLA